jgi:cytochrome P450
MDRELLGLAPAIGDRVPWAAGESKETEMSDFETANFYTDQSVFDDPHPYYNQLRSKCPVFREPHFGTMMVTGLQEGLEVYRQPDAFSSCVALNGPIPALPFEPKGDDISEELSQHRNTLPWSRHFITFDEPEHTAHRNLLTRLLTQNRLKQSQKYLQRTVDLLIDRIIDNSPCEIVSQYAYPATTLVVMEMLGVPEMDRLEFLFQLGAPKDDVGSADHLNRPDPMKYLEARFTTYLQERQRQPRDDLMSELVQSRFKDGSQPEFAELLKIAVFLFAAGQDTASKLITSSLKTLGECPHLQQRLRAEPHRIPDFIEEVLRTQTPARVNFRLARRTAEIAGVTVPAGTVVTVALGAANRDPRHFEEPDEFRLGRANVRDHIAFGRGLHACPGAPWARLEAQITLERFLARTSEIRISEAAHGPANARRFHYAPTYLLYGLMTLHLELAKSQPVEVAKRQPELA